MIYIAIALTIAAAVAAFYFYALKEYQKAIDEIHNIFQIRHRR